MRKFLFIALVLLVGTNIFLFKRLDSVRKERDRLDSNQAALLSDVEHYKTEAGKNATSVLRLELTKNELEKKNKDLTKTVDDLNIKLKRIQAATTTATKTEIEIETKVRDSIVYRNQLDTLLNFRWRDSWIDLRGTIDKGVLFAKIESADTLHHIIHKIPKKFLFFRFGVKAIKMDVVNSNPHNKITYTEYIELKNSFCRILFHFRTCILRSTHVFVSLQCRIYIGVALVKTSLLFVEVGFSIFFVESLIIILFLQIFYKNHNIRCNPLIIRVRTRLS